MEDLSADVVVIGSGPTGAAAVWRLAMRGVDVLCLERGTRLDATGLGRDAPDWEVHRRRELSSNPNLRLAAGQARLDDDPVDDAGSPIKPMVAHGVGGTSPFWSAHVPRFRPADFTMFSDDGVGADWPLGYDDLAPYYAAVEAQWGTAGVEGDPTLPPRTENDRAPLHPIPTIGALGERFGTLFDRRGWHWWTVDLVVGKDPSALGGACTHPGPCDLGCPARRRSSADHAFLEEAVANGARLMDGTRVLKLEVGADGHVTAALCRRGDREFRVRAGRFILAASGMGTPRLLLVSGLANSSGMVGRNLMLHPYARVDGTFDAPVGGWLRQEIAGIVSFEFFGTDRSRGFLRGMKLQLTSGPGPMATARGGVTGRPLPWGAAHHDAFEQSFDRSCGFTVSADDLPEPENRIDLSERLVGRDGLPAARWHYRVGENSRKILDFGMARATELLRDAGAQEIFTTPLRSQAGFHIMGTARMGEDPASSVCDSFGRCHDHANLFIADASTFVTASSINPTATAQALALRTADHVAGEIAGTA